MVWTNTKSDLLSMVMGHPCNKLVIDTHRCNFGSINPPIRPARVSHHDITTRHDIACNSMTWYLNRISKSKWAHSSSINSRRRAFGSSCFGPSGTAFTTFQTCLPCFVDQIIREVSELGWLQPRISLTKSTKYWVSNQPINQPTKQTNRARNLLIC